MAIAKTWMQAVGEDGEVCIKLGGGVERRGQAHHAYRGAGGRGLRGRALDLKQLAARPSMLRAAVICLCDPDRKKRSYFILKSAPLGARNVVYVFGAVARASEKILVVAFAFLVCQYVDDYPNLEPAAAANRGIGPEDVLDLLGWEVKSVDGEIPKHEDRFECLGVEIDLQPTVEKKALVRVKASRVRKIGDLVADVRDAGPSRAKGAES